MKKLILILMIAMFTGASAQQVAPNAQALTRFQIHKERCELRHERNGVHHDFRKFHRYMHFKRMMHRHHRRHMMKMMRPMR